MLIDNGIVLDGWIYNLDFSLKVYFLGDIFCQGMNFQRVEWSIGLGIEDLKVLTPGLSCKVYNFWLLQYLSKVSVLEEFFQK